MNAPFQPAVSVVTVLKDRYANFRNCVRCLRDVEEVGSVEHVVVDFCSTDGSVPELYTTGELAYQHLLVEGPFTLNRGRNLGVERASAEIIFLCDADVLLDRRLVHILRENVAEGRMLFPIIRDLHRDCNPADLWQEVLKPGRLGRWRTAGYGICGFHRKDWAKVGRFDEVRFTKWGGDDLDFFRRAQKACRITRTKRYSFYHQHHSRAPAFLNKHYQPVGALPEPKC